jgi:dihydroorotase (multifunctional complex type)
LFLVVVDLVVKRGRLATERGLLEAGVAIDDRKIVSISKTARLPKAAKVIDCRGKIVLPGVIDAHVHVFSPGWLGETFRSGTRAAALGGVTTLLDMPSEDPYASTSVQRFERKRALAQREAYVNFGLYGGEIEKLVHAKAIPSLARRGAVGFKIITGGPGYVTEDVLLEAFQRIKSADSVAVVHAENQELIDYYASLAREKGRVDPVAFSEFRPSIVEEEAARRVTLYTSLCRNRLHFAHLTSEAGVKVAWTAKAAGVSVTAETCPHYLLLSEKDYRKYRHLMVVTPPIKKNTDLQALWKGLNDRTIDLVASDHCAYYRKDKDRGARSVWATPPGMPGLETMVPLLLSEGVNKSRITLRRLIQLISETPARIFGLYPLKGTIKQGSDADLTIVDMKLRHKINTDRFECAGDFSPFDGWKLKGAPVMTIVGGQVVAEDGQVVGSEGWGHFVKPGKRS